MNPKVSIITITRNRADLLARCIKSIQSQTFSDYEHVIVDGASTDNTQLLVESYNDSHITYVRLKENLSLCDCWQIALDTYKGDYLTFLDDDDEYLPTKLEKQVRLMDSLPKEYGLVYCWMSYFDSKSHEYLSTHKAELRGYVLAEAVESEKVCGTPTLMVRRGIWEEIRKMPKVAIASDWLSGARICRNYKVDYIPEVLVNVYVNHGHIRMSDTGYYNNLLEREIQFHKDFLEEFKDVFETEPKRSVHHLTSMVGCYFKLGRFSEGWPYYKRLLQLDFSFKNLIRPIYGYKYYLQHGRNRQK